MKRAHLRGENMPSEMGGIMAIEVFKELDYKI